MKNKNKSYKPGDILVTNIGSIFIFKKEYDDTVFDYVYLSGIYNELKINNSSSACFVSDIDHYALDEEKQKLFEELKKVNKKWNPETLQIEDTGYKPGDILVSRTGTIFIYRGSNKGRASCYASLGDPFETIWMSDVTHYADSNEKAELFELLKKRGKQWNPIKLKIENIPHSEFKKGDILISKSNNNLIVIFYKRYSNLTFDSLYNNQMLGNICWNIDDFRHTTMEERQRFFNELKEQGKYWNMKELEIEDIFKPIFKKGDILTCIADNRLILIFEKYSTNTLFCSMFSNFTWKSTSWDIKDFRYSTEDEKEKFFNELKKQGLCWKAEKLCIGAIPESLKKGDIVIAWQLEYEEKAIIGILLGIDDDHVPYHVGKGYYTHAIKWDGTQKQYEKILNSNRKG